MKNKHLFFSLITFMFLTFFTSCSEEVIQDETNPTVTEQPDSETETEAKTLDFITKIKVMTNAGHLHGKKFHGNGQPDTDFRRKNYFFLERNEDGSWNYLPSEDNNDRDYLSEGKPVVMEGIDKVLDYSTRYAFEFTYYNEAGEEVNSKMFDESEVYQSLFSVENYTENETKKVVTVESTKDFFKYTRRDTDPANKMLKKGEAAITDSYLGFKGYAITMKSRISYTLKINLVRFKSKEAKKESIYLEDADSEQFEDKITIEIPIVIPVERSAEDHSEVFGKYFNMTAEDFEELDTFGAYDNEASQYWM